MLLQRLLQSMEDPNTPRSQATYYAILTLFVRLIVCQSDVFSLWFSRRCYERSRGEMLTMLHAKTLSRKRFGDSAQSETNNDEDLDSFQGSKSKKGKRRIVLGALFARVTRFFRTKKRDCKSTKPASTGKVFNIMRCVISIICILG